jgi:hypothetical protein
MKQTTILVLAAASACLLAATSVHANLVQNGTFTSGLTDWTVDQGTVTAGALAGAPGGHAAKMYAKSTQFYTSDFYQNMTLPTGPEIVTFWAGGSTAGVMDVSLDGLILYITAPTSSSWTEYSFLVTPTDTGLQPIDFDWNSAGGATLDIADVSVTPVPEASTMIAGALLILPFGASTLRILRRRLLGVTD